jgi:phosphoadenosine phosphosulfate reductase
MTVSESEQLNKQKLEYLNEQFEVAKPQDILVWVNEYFGDKVIQMSSFGIEDVALFDMFWHINPQARLATIDTWRLPTETYAVIDEVKERYKTNIEIHQPNLDDVNQMVEEYGFNLFYRSIPNRLTCCHIRKVEPLDRALASVKAWITGLRRNQGTSRITTPIIEWDEAHTCYKINPLAGWTFSQVRNYVDKNSIPYNKLHDRGYPSIGCAPCTRAIKPDEDPRSGRWWWESNQTAKECGLHPVKFITH